MAGKTIVVTERRIESGPRAIYQCLSTGISTTPTQIHQSRDGLGGQRGTSSFAGTAAGYARAVFLPDGYPQSVSDDYMPYQLWDTLQAFCSTITGILAQRVRLSLSELASTWSYEGIAKFLACERKLSQTLFALAENCFVGLIVIPAT